MSMAGCRPRRGSIVSGERRATWSEPSPTRRTPSYAGVPAPGAGPPKRSSATFVTSRLFQIRFHTVVALDEPPILVFGASANDLAAWRIGGAIRHPLDPEQWAEERQYLRNDTREALAAFERRRAEVLTLLQSLSPAEWRRGGLHLGRGRLTLGDWVARLAAHDDNHLDQLARALQGRA